MAAVVLAVLVAVGKMSNKLGMVAGLASGALGPLAVIFYMQS